MEVVEAWRRIEHLIARKKEKSWFVVFGEIMQVHQTAYL
jgi:hypothetical protein